MAGRFKPPEPDSSELNQALALSFCLSMIFSENRLPLFRIMLYFYCVINSARDAPWPQHGHRGKVLAIALAKRMRMVAIEFWT